MSELDDFNQLFNGLKDRVKELTKLEATRQAEVAALEARKQFIEQSIDQADERRKQQEAKHDQVVLSEGVELDIIKSAQEEARAELDKVNADIQAKHLEIQQALIAKEEEVKRLEAVVIQKKQAITEVETELAKAEQVLDDYKEQVEEKDTELVELNAALDTRRDEVNARFASLNAEEKLITNRLAHAQAQLNDVNQQLAAKQQQLAGN